jgi:hypothetical protein
MVSRVESSQGGVLPLAALEEEMRTKFRDPHLDLRRGNWLHGLVRLPLAVTSDDGHVIR